MIYAYTRPRWIGQWMDDVGCWTTKATNERANEENNGPDDRRADETISSSGIDQQLTI